MIDTDDWEEYKYDPEDDEHIHDEWLDRWLEKCAALKNTALVCPLAGTEECDFECPFRTQYDGPRKKRT
jgi:hypothetical protein